MLRIGVDKGIAGALAGARVCALRYDKRGVGASGGEYLRAGIDDRLADARAALGWLAARTGGLPLLAIGHSEGVPGRRPGGAGRHLPASDVRRAGTTLRPLRLRYCWASELDLMVRLAACGWGSATRTGTAAR